MGEGRELRTGSGRPPHQALVERIVAGAAGASREERARAVVEAIAELLERDVAGAFQALADLAEDEAARQRLAVALDRPIHDAFALVTGATVALCPWPRSPHRRDRVARTIDHLLAPRAQATSAEQVTGS